MPRPRTFEQYHSRGLEQANLRACGACGVLVAGEDRDFHTEWHRQLALVVLPEWFRVDSDGVNT